MGIQLWDLFPGRGVLDPPFYFCPPLLTLDLANHGVISFVHWSSKKLKSSVYVQGPLWTLPFYYHFAVAMHFLCTLAVAWYNKKDNGANQDSSERVVDQMIPKLSLSGTAAGTNAIPIGLTPPQDLNCIWGRLEPRRRPHEVWDTTAMHLCPCKRAQPIVATGLSKLSTVIVIFFTTNKTIQGSSIPICPGRPYHVDMGNFKYAF